MLRQPRSVSHVYCEARVGGASRATDRLACCLVRLYAGDYLRLHLPGAGLHTVLESCFITIVYEKN